MDEDMVGIFWSYIVVIVVQFCKYTEKPLNYMLQNGDYRLGVLAEWETTCLVYVRPWF